jgi:tetratricopeptide (TPR) repeat protein/predicted Ser/Thr protein kinase
MAVTPPDADPPSGSDPDLSAAPAGPADSLEALLGQAVHAPAELPALTVGEELVGRFRIERLVGVGGMGSVYLAHDRSLERQVAIKLHHATGGAARLHREAVAMARLAHPNVIAVFEVGSLGEQTFVAMEFIPGTTLRAWLDAAPRTARARLAMLLGAGEGLAAAHDAGLVHRDFKPENVLVGDDGRPRVGDFGLARGSQSQDDHRAVDLDRAPPADAANPALTPRTSSGRLATPLTRTGAVLGTPAYMAPEQAEGRDVDPRADQFAFGVVAWEALYGARPFVGASLRELHDAALAGPRRPPRTAGVRPAIRRVLERSLAAAPGDRFPDMRALLAALRRAARPPVALLAGAALGITAVATAALLLHALAAPSCDGAGAELTAALPHDLGARIRAAGGPFAVDGAARVEAALAAFTASYRANATHACRAAKVDHAWSDELARQAEACLAIRRGTATALLTVARVDAAEIPDLVQRVRHLPLLDVCTDATALAAAPALPAVPGRLAPLIAARATLDAAALDVTLDHVARARAAVAEVAASEVASEPTVAARLALVRGGVLRDEDRLQDSEQAYRDAYFAGRASDDVEVTLPAVAALISSSGALREDATAAEGWIRNGLADAERAHRRNPTGASAVHAAAAHVLMLEDHLPAARDAAQAAVDLLGTTPSLDLADALAVLGQVQCALHGDDACFALERRGIKMTTELLGDGHPRVAAALANLALNLSLAGRFDEATEAARQARAILADAQSASSVDLAHTQTDLAAILINRGDVTQYPAARQLLDQARVRLVATLGEHHPDIAQVEADLALLDNADGHSDVALARLQRALAIQERALGATSGRAADTLFNLAATLRDLKRYPEALAAAERVIAIRVALAPGSLLHGYALTMAAEIANLAGDHPHAERLADDALAQPGAAEARQGRAWPLIEAARARLRRHHDLATAAAMLREARGLWAAEQSPDRVHECDELLAQLPR